MSKVQYYAISVEFQVRGSPHIHSFLWVLNQPKLTVDTIDQYIEFLDAVVSANLPSEEADPLLHNVERYFQVHSHLKSGRKYKNKPSRYHFGRFFTERTLIAKPVQNVSEFQRYSILAQRKCVLDKVSEFINIYLCLNKPGTYIDNLEIDQISDQILEQLGVPETDYYSALSISNDDYQVHLKRKGNSCFINNYNPIMLKAWQANMDLQALHNYYKAISYISAYFPKSENETSLALK